MTIQQSLDQTARHGNELRPEIARLIAAHLHLGPRSALYRFAVNGAVRDALFDELDQIHADQPANQAWVHALGRYCVNRLDWEPIIDWQPASDAAAPSHGAADMADSGRGRTKRRTSGIAAMGKRVPIETVQQLLDAAFELGQRAAQHSMAQPSR